MKGRLLIIEDNRALANAIAARAEAWGYVSDLTPTLALARKHLSKQNYAAIILDLGLPDGNGLELFASLDDKKRPAIAILTAHGDVEHVIEARKAGAQEFLFKPIDFKALQQFLENHANREETFGEKGRFSSTFIGAAPAMREVLQQIALACASDRNVIISGERGSGRSHVARLITSHLSTTQPILPFHRDLLETMPVEGGLLIENAETLDLDAQLALTRSPHLAQRRIIAITTHTSLRDAVRTHELHPDYYYRLQGIDIVIPPLRERSEDIPSIATLFLAELAGSPPVKLSKEAEEKLQGFPWPGNLKELKQELQLALARCPDRVIRSCDLSIAEQTAEKSELSPLQSAIEIWLRDQESVAPLDNYKILSEHLEKLLLQQLLNRFDQRPSVLARELGINRTTLRTRLEKLRLRPN